ncbi:hypothetical protein DFS34DRAFT_224427 [Phlyctochytrium arcticum]|nr:hypothetical protein DFS34DRAFT_224427 [Phlyctochytrium arcticum]
MSLNLAIIGPGLVGSEFIAQVASHPLLKIVAIANSTRMLLSPSTVTNWQNDIKASETKSDIQALTSYAEKHKPCVVVDCTSSNEIAAKYPEWVAKGLHIVTPNKKGFSGDLNLWKQTVEGSGKDRGLVYHESTVGAGLPILSTLRDLVDTGDEIVKIEGIFSGTLSYLFNNFSSPEGSSGSFSAAVKVAKDLGYTEPDPRDDLNGLDVARKVVILGRAAGLPLSLDTLPIENIVPAELRDVPSADDFMSRLPEFDNHFGKLNDEAFKSGSVLRYVGLVDPKGESSVKLVKFPFSHPFASLKGSDNIIAFTTKRFPNPLIVQGAGAGAAVTAFGMFSDVLKITRQVL